MKSHWVMDYETLSNFFCGVFKHYKKEEYKVFVIHSKRDDRIWQSVVKGGKVQENMLKSGYLPPHLR